MKNILIVLYLLPFAMITGVYGQTVQLTEEEKDGLVYLYEEDKLAHDFYMEMEKKWAHHAFTNIIKAETRHMSMIKEEAERLGVDRISVLDDGKFVNEDLQSLYDDFMVKGKVSLLDALKTSAFIEETDINDLELKMVQTDVESLQELYGNLVSASENHLNAFVRNIKKEGETYSPQVLSQERFDMGITEGKGKEKGKTKACCDSKKSGKKGKCCSSKNSKAKCASEKTSKKCKGKESS
ncbi:MAG: DUF2202 domain-containing protein [Bacteroidia bacterium]|nr:DUF2202 domain-containing protein [Bacteroidia bacterium]